MVEILAQVTSNLRANKLRSFLTMFGILWGVISVVILSATGEGFRRGNEHVLKELGKNIAIVWGGRTSLQAGGERAGRRIAHSSVGATVNVACMSNSPVSVATTVSPLVVRQRDAGSPLRAPSRARHPRSDPPRLRGMLG